MLTSSPPRSRLEVTNQEGDVLAQLASEVPAGHLIVEIGSYRGRSTVFLADGSHRGQRARVIAVDLWGAAPNWEEGEQGKIITRPYNRPAVRLAFDGRIAAEGHGLVHAVQGDSVRVAREWDLGPIGLVFIDGSHAYDDVVADIEAWVPHVAPGGIVVLHDWALPRVAAAIRATIDTLSDFERVLELPREEIEEQPAGGLVGYRRAVP